MSCETSFWVGFGFGCWTLGIRRIRFSRFFALLFFFFYIEIKRLKPFYYKLSYFLVSRDHDYAHGFRGVSSPVWGWYDRSGRILYDYVIGLPKRQQTHFPGIEEGRVGESAGRVRKVSAHESDDARVFPGVRDVFGGVRKRREREGHVAVARKKASSFLSPNGASGLCDISQQRC